MTHPSELPPPQDTLLPPTPVSEKAYTTMLELGISEERIRELQRITSLLRYDRCIERAAALTDAPAYLYQNPEPDKPDYIILPKYNGLPDDQTGECGHLTMRLFQQLHVSGWLHSVNDILASRPDGVLLYPAVAKGLADTHFIAPNAQHATVVLSLSDSQYHTHPTIRLDPSFQRITHYDERVKHMGKREIFEHPKSPMAFSDTVTIPLGYYFENTGMNNSGSVVMGISSNGHYAISIGFARVIPLEHTDTPFIQPYVKASDRNGFESHAITINGNTRYGGEIPIGSTTKNEVEAMLRYLDTIRITDDVHAIHDALTKVRHLYW